MTRSPEALALARDSRRNARSRSIWHGSRSAVPFALEVLVGLIAWLAWKAIDRWTAHVRHLREVQRWNAW